VKSRVALIKGTKRYDNLAQALALIEDDIDLSDKKRILIKPNFVSTREQLASTHVEAVRAVLDWLRPRHDGPITIGEGAAVSETFDGYRNFGYLDLAEEYNVRFVDLNQDEWTPVQVYDRRLRLWQCEWPESHWRVTFASLSARPRPTTLSSSPSR